MYNQNCIIAQKSYTFSDVDRGVPISCTEKIMQATVPSHEHANKQRPFELHDRSNTLSSNSSFITTRGRFNDVNHTLMDLSREPIAQQQYCWVLL